MLFHGVCTDDVSFLDPGGYCGGWRDVMDEARSHPITRWLTYSVGAG
jgi:hypothetical protein